MDIMLRQMAVTVNKGATFSRAHVEMHEKVRSQPQITNASSVKLATEASKSCSESKIGTNSAKRQPLQFSRSKSFISDSLKFFLFIKHDKGGKKTKNLGCADVPVFKQDMKFKSALAIKEDNLLEVDSATKRKPLLMPVENFPELKTRKTDYVNTAVKHITGWLHSVWSYRRPRSFSKSHPTSVAPDDLYLCNECEQQMLSGLLRYNNVQIAVRYSATPEGQWQENKTAEASEVAAQCPESGFLVEDPSVEHDHESFSRFLHKVPLAEIKTVSHLADLCSLAYMIPEMKTGDLLSQHNLSFVTSSLDRKAQASEKEKAANKVISLSPNESQNIIKASIFNDAFSLSSSAWYTTNSGAPSCFLPDGNSVVQLRRENADVGNGLAQTFNTVFPVDVERAKNVVHSQVFSSLRDGENLGALAQECYAKHHSLDDLPQSTPEACLLHTCPCEWFCCDDIATRTRYFVIQGSESLASWQANLAFDPVQFENASLGVLVHRGIYEAAKGLYLQLLPDILEHLKRHGNEGRIRFTGHSLGGSLATLLFMMLHIRKAVTADVFLPVMTFGSPSIMCGGDNMLEKLSIPQSHIQSVVMHRDIVPRSFSCHYPDHIAEVLKRIYGVFRQHSCLIHQRLLYAPMGDFYILQPDEGIAPPHPFLPEGSGLYLMRHPIQHQGMLGCSKLLQAALRAFFNSPHPLEILGNPGSYGSNGSIARNHDPRSYAEALDVVLLQELERQMHKKSKKNRQLWWPLFAALSSVEDIGGLGLIESQSSRGAISSKVGMMHHELRQSVSSAMRGGQHMSMVTALGAILSRNVRYKRLIASQHVQMGMLFIFSAKVLLLEAFLAVFSWV